MKGFIVPAAALLMAALLTPARSVVAQTPVRLSDKEVKALFEVIDNGRDHFQDRLDGKVKDSVVRGPSQEVRVDKFLDDLRDNVAHLKDRFESKYAASAEAATVFRQATAIDAFIKQQPADLKGVSEWHHLAVDLNRLAVVYGTKFPLDDPARAIRRINDGEAAEAAARIQQEAEHLKDALGNEKMLAEPTKDSLKKAADVVRERADKLKSRLQDSEPSTAEATLLFDAIRRLESASMGVSLSTGPLNPMGAISTPLDTLRQAFQAM